MRRYALILTLQKTSNLTNYVVWHIYNFNKKICLLNHFLCDSHYCESQSICLCLIISGVSIWLAIFGFSIDFRNKALVSCSTFKTLYWEHREPRRKIHIFWEVHNILRNLHQLFDWRYIGQIIGGDFAKFCGLLRIYEL